MLTKLVDLTHLCVIKEVQHLANSEEYQDNLILQNPYFKQQLIEYVLSSINHRYAIIELTEIPEDASKVFPQCPLGERVIIKQFLLMGMSKIICSLLQRTEKNNSNLDCQEKAKQTYQDREN